MAGNGALALDKIVINIESGVGNTHKNIDKLAKSLEGLKKSTSGGFKHISKLADGIKELNKATKGLPNTIKDLKTITKIIRPLNSLGEISKPSGLISTINALEKLPKVFKEINPKSLENVLYVSSKLASALEPLSDKLSKIGNGFSALSTLSKTYGIQTTKVSSSSKDMANQLGSAYSSLRLIGKVFTTIGRANISVVKDFDKAFDSLARKVKITGLALLGTRSIFTAIRKAVSEYMALDQQLTKETQNLWRALGAQLVPAVEAALHIFKQIIRVIYSVIYALTGIDLIAKANAKALASMGSSAGNALGNLQKFDDLNVAEFGKDNGDDNLIKLDKIDLSPIQKVIDWMKKLKDAILDAWNNGGWNDVAKVLAEGLNGAAASIDPTTIATAIGKGAVGALEFIRTFIENSDWGLIGKKIGDTFRNIPWSTIWQEAVKTAESIFKGMDDFWDNLFNFEGASEIIGGGWITNKLVSLVGSSEIVKFFIDIIAHSDKLINKFDILKTKAGDIWNAFDLLSKGVLPEMVGATSHISKGFAKMLSPIASVSGKLSGLFGGSLAGGTAATIGLIVVAVLALVQAFKNLYENSQPFRETVDGLIDSIKGTFLTVLDTLKNMLLQLWEVLVVFWEEVLKPVFDLLVSIVEPFLESLIEILAVLWKNAIQPLVEGLMNFLAPAFSLVMDVVKALMVVIGAIIDVIQWLWTYLLRPIVDFLLDVVVGAIKVIGVIVETVIDFVAGYFEWLVNVFRTGWEILKGGFLAVYKYVKEKFIDPLVKAWEKIKEGWDKMWDGVKSGAKSAINWLLEKVENFINRIIRGINGLSSGLRKIGNKIFDIIGIDVTFDPISEISLPRLETGTNEVPYEGIYHLHQGEAVVPKKYNPALGNGTDEELGQKLDTLINIMGNMNWTNVVNIGNKTIYKEQQRYNKMQNDKYGTTVNL